MTVSLPITMSADELQAITGYRCATDQLRVLHARGFLRAYIGRRGLILERAHYEAVCRGEFGQGKPPARAAANLDFLRVPRSA